MYRWDRGVLYVVLCGRWAPATWSLPKGTPEDRETLEQTALREVKEETGLEVEIGQSLGIIDYWFSSSTQIRFHKTVSFYLMHPRGGALDLHDPEFDEVRWFVASDGLKVLTHLNEVNVLRRALKLLGVDEMANA